MHLRAADEKQNGFRQYIVKNKIALWAPSYSASVVYTKTIIHLSVGEKGGYLPRCGGSVNIHHYSPPLRWIIVNYWGWQTELTNLWPSFLDRSGIWEFGVLVFRGGRNTREPEEKHLEQGPEPTINSTHIRRLVWELNQATVAGGKCFHHGVIPAPHSRIKSCFKFTNLELLGFSPKNSFLNALCQLKRLLDFKTITKG